MNGTEKKRYTLRDILSATDADGSEAAMGSFLEALVEERFRPFPHRQDTLSYGAALLNFFQFRPVVRKRFEADIMGRWNNFSFSNAGETVEEAAHPEIGEEPAVSVPEPELSEDTVRPSSRSTTERIFPEKTYKRDWFDNFLDFFTVMLHPGYVPE